ncbi:MAG: helicase RepA family protein [Actinomycetota bacterium]|nr:helicase RepA family protein [Actinomycetota bacterium]
MDEIISEAGESVPWVIENVLARGALTEFSGLAKKGGKTTFWCHTIVAGARGEDHAGFATTPAKYLYLTEQGNNFAGVLRDSGLSEYPDHIRIVQFKDVSAVGWDTLIHQAGDEAKRRNLDALIVDTFAVFARLKGSEENDSGPVADRMRVLRLVAQKYNIAVVLIRHAGKDGTPRGSSAFEAEADICVTLSRPEGRHAPNVRRIAGIGRYGEWERNIQLVDGRFISLGTDNKIEFNKAVKLIKAVLPGSPEGGLKKQEIMDKRSGEDEEISASTLDRALAWLVKQGDVGEKQLMDQRGKPKVYWLA